MDNLTLRLVPTSPFGTPLMGDTLFGQFCWALRHRHGEARLTELLAGYLEGHPFAVISDALPAGYVPRPAIPLSWFGSIDPSVRKEIKKRRWLPITALANPSGWLEGAVALTGAKSHPQPHNTLDRVTGTTGGDGFAPYTTSQHWYPAGFAMDCYVLHDPKRITSDEVARLFEDIGASGFGRDASIGLGRFIASAVATQIPAAPGGASAWLTLAACAPQGLGLDPERSFYEVFTRFGRHGDMAVHTGNPFKAPILLVRAGAILTPRRFERLPFVGQGLGGDGRLSRKVPATVHQGYAPVVDIALPRREELS